MDALRRFLLPCLRHTTTTSPSASPPPATASKKRLSSSLSNDLYDNSSNQETNHELHSSSSSSSSLSTSPTTTVLPYAPPRSSRTMVTGTIFGHRRGGHVWFCIQQDRLSSKPALLLELCIPISTLIQEMQCGLVRIALESNSAESGLSTCPLRSIPLWTLYCNGRKLGFAVRRKATQQNKAMLRTMRSITVGAGVIPGFGSGPGQQEETMYMRTNYECVLGNVDSESFHLINPDEGPGQELSIFLMRSR